MIFVIAGNEPEAYDYINRKLEERIRNGDSVSKIDDYKYVHDVKVLRGIENPKGVFIGSWKQRVDIKDIVQQLMIASRSKNPTLTNIWLELINQE